MQDYCEKGQLEPNDETLLVSQIKRHNQETKAEEDFEQNMALFETDAPGFRRSDSRVSLQRDPSCQSFYTYADTINQEEVAVPSEAAQDMEEEMKRQEMQVTSLSFFKTAKSTSMSMNQSSQGGFGGQHYQIERAFRESEGGD